MFVQQLINALVVSGIYTLMGIGLTMVYSILRILHVAHAAVYVLGAYSGLYAYQFTGSILISLLAAMGVCAAIGVLMGRVVYLPLLDAPRIIPLIASIGLFIFMEDLFRLVAGPYILSFQARLPWPTLLLRHVVVTAPQLLILVVSGTLVTGVWLLITRTRLGLAWQAAAQDAEVAMALGVNVSRIVSFNFALGSALAAAAGVLIGINYNEVQPGMGSVPAYKMLAIIVLGGLGNVPGTVAAAAVVGFAETFMVGYVGFILPRDAIAFVALIIILLVRPQGILGRGAVA